MAANIPRAARAASAHLEPGEQILGACQCQPRGSVAAMALGGALGAVIGLRGRKNDREQAAAAGHPYLAKICVLVPTNRRLLVVSGKKFLGAIEADELAGAEVVKKRTISPWTIRIDLANGSSVAMEAIRTMKPDQLVDTLNKLASAPPSHDL